MSISDFSKKRQEPQDGDLVLGGTAPSPEISTAVVLGGHSKRLPAIFTLFNSRAKPCNGEYLRLQIDYQIALVRHRKDVPLDPIRIKVWFQQPVFYDGKQIFYWYWDFAGYLKHDGSLFGESARYDHARCRTELRAIAQHALNKLALELQHEHY